MEHLCSDIHTFPRKNDYLKCDIALEVKALCSNLAFSFRYLIRRLLWSETARAKQLERALNKCTISRSVVLQTVCNHLRKLRQSLIAGSRGNRNNSHSSTRVGSPQWAAHFHATLDLWKPGIVEMWKCANVQILVKQDFHGPPSQLLANQHFSN